MTRHVNGWAADESIIIQIKLDDKATHQFQGRLLASQPSVNIAYDATRDALTSNWQRDLKSQILQAIKNNFAAIDADLYAAIAIEHDKDLLDTKIQYTTKINELETHVMNRQTLLQHLRTCQAMEKPPMIVVYVPASVIDSAYPASINTSTGTTVATSITIPTKHVSVPTPAMAKRTDIADDYNARDWMKHVHNFPPDDAQIIAWYESLVMLGGPYGVGLPQLCFITKNNAYGDLQDPCITPSQLLCLPLWSQYLAQALRKDEMFPKGREQCHQLVVAAGNNGHLAMHNILRMSRKHPLLLELGVQPTIPKQGNNTSFAEHGVAILLCVKAEALQRRFYTPRQHAELFISTLLAYYVSAFTSRFVNECKVVADERLVPFMLEYPNLPATLEGWKLEMKLDHRPSVPSHLRQIVSSEEPPDLSQLMIAQLHDADEFWDQVHAFSDSIRDGSLKICGCCGRPGHEETDCDALIKDLVINNYKDKNQAKVTDLKKQHDQFPDRRPRRSATASRQRSRARNVRQVTDMHDNTDTAHAMALAQLSLPPTSSSSNDDNDEEE